MTDTAREITNGKGDRMVFLKTGADTHGELLEMEAHYRPHSAMPPVHFHPLQQERFEIMRGEYRAGIGGEQRTYRVGDVFEIPPGVPHWMNNVSGEPGQLLWQVRPALHTEDMFRILFGLARDGKTNEAGAPNLLQLAVILRAYKNEFAVSSPPPIVQGVLFPVLASIGRLLGHSAVYSP